MTTDDLTGNIIRDWESKSNLKKFKLTCKSTKFGPMKGKMSKQFLKALNQMKKNKGYKYKGILYKPAK